MPGVVLTGDREGRGIVGISLGKLVCTDSDRPELFSDEGDGVADSGLTAVSLTGTVVEEAEVEPEELKERPGVLGVLGVLGRLGAPPLGTAGLPPPSVSTGSLVLSSLRESSSNTDFLFRSF